VKKAIQVLAALGLLSTTACVSSQYKSRLNSPEAYATYIQSESGLPLKTANSTERFWGGAHRPGSVIPKGGSGNYAVYVTAEVRGQDVKFTIEVDTEASFNFLIEAVVVNGTIRTTSREETDMSCSQYGCKQLQRLFVVVSKSELAKTPGKLQVQTLDHCGTLHTVIVPDVAAQGLLMVGK